MPHEYTGILLKEYEIVNEHWMLATRQKETVVQITGGLVVALLGAGIYEHVQWPVLAVISPIVVIVAAFVYAQKEADYWAAAFCLESIERCVNMIEKAELMEYAHKFKSILFQRRRGSQSPIRLMQVLRLLPCGMFFAACCYTTLKEYGSAAFVSLCALLLVGVFYVFYSRAYVISKADKCLTERLQAISLAMEEISK